MLTSRRLLFLPVLLLPGTLHAQPADTAVVTLNEACAVGYVNLYGGLFNLGPDCATYSGPNSCAPDSGIANGVNGNWRGPNAVNWLVGRLEELYGLGIRKVMVNRPMGGSGVSHVTGAAWLTIPAYKRAQLEDQLAPWLAAHPDLILGVFIGSRWIELDSLMGYRTDMGPYPGTTHGFDPLVPIEIDAWHQVVDPWWGIGVRWVVLDAASMPANRDWFLRLAAYEAGLRNMEITAEAITDQPSHHVQAAWIALAPTFIEHPSRPHANAGPVALADHHTTWYAWLNLSDLPGAFANGHVPSDDPAVYIQSLIARGYVPMATAAEFQTYPQLPGLIQDCDLATSASAAEPPASRIHPNPTEGPLFIDARPGARYALRDAMGRPLRAGALPPSHPIDLTHLPPGVYLLVVDDQGFRVLKQ